MNARPFYGVREVVAKRQHVKQDLRYCCGDARPAYTAHRQTEAAQVLGEEAQRQDVKA